MAIYKLDYVLPIDDAFEIMKKNSKKMKFKQVFNLNDTIGNVIIFIDFLDFDKMKIILKTSKITKEFKTSYINLNKSMNIICLSFVSNGEYVILRLNLKFCREKSNLKYLDNKDFFFDLECSVKLGERSNLLDYMEYFDFNSILNIIYGGYILISLNFNNISNNKDDETELMNDYNNLRDMFVSKLKKLGIDIPKKSKEDIENIKGIMDRINIAGTISPEDCAFLFISTIPEGYKEQNEYIDSHSNLGDAMNNMFERYNDIDLL